jgi:sugar/nucleoside kinase (ribokinase family)
LLPFIRFLKASEEEMNVLTGIKDVRQGAKLLSDWGAKEVIITLGSKGSVIYTEQNFYLIPAYVPTAVNDATGCGDTYMAGYLSQRVKGINIQEAGEFAAAMATLKITSAGPFTGTKEDVQLVMKTNRKVFPV